MVSYDNNYQRIKRIESIKLVQVRFFSPFCYMHGNFNQLEIPSLQIMMASDFLELNLQGPQYYVKVVSNPIPWEKSVERLTVQYMEQRYVTVSYRFNISYIYLLVQSLHKLQLLYVMIALVFITKTGTISEKSREIFGVFS